MYRRPSERRSVNIWRASSGANRLSNSSVLKHNRWKLFQYNLRLSDAKLLNTAAKAQSAEFFPEATLSFVSVLLILERPLMISDSVEPARLSLERPLTSNVPERLSFPRLDLWLLGAERGLRRLCDGSFMIVSGLRQLTSRDPMDVTVADLVHERLTLLAEHGREELREDSPLLASWRWRRLAQDTVPIMFDTSDCLPEHLLSLTSW